MHPRAQRVTLGDRKAVVLCQIALHRLACRQAARGLIEPLTWIDDAAHLWRGVSRLVRSVAPLMAACRADAPKPSGPLDGLARLVRAFALGRKIFVFVRGIVPQWFDRASPRSHPGRSRMDNETP